MKYSPHSRKLYTNKLILIKQLNCPINAQWDDMLIGKETSRTCQACSHRVVDTQYLTDDELIKIFENKKETCIKIDFSQSNLALIGPLDSMMTEGEL